MLAVLTIATAWACSNGRATDPAAAAGSFAPRLERNGSRVVLSWVEPDAAGVPALRFSVREGKGWTPPRVVTRDAGLAASPSDVPSVVPFGERGLAAQWTVKRNGSTQSRNLVVAVSSDDGASWSRPVRPHRDDTDSEHGMATLLPAMAGSGFGICWLDGRAGALAEYGAGGTALYWAEWNGEAFGTEVELDPRVCDCCKTSAASGPDGPIVAYRDRSDKELRDISVVRRDGTGWTAPQPVHLDGWSLTACPTNGPAIATLGERAAVAWFTGAGAQPSVWVALSSDGGKSLGAPMRLDEGSPVGRVDATMLADGSTAVSWLERKGQNAEVRVRRVTTEGVPMPSVVAATTSPARASGYPSVVSDGANGVLVAWTDVGARGRVRAKAIQLP
jgi:hypothetical protein